MNITDMLNLTASVAVIVERITEILKPAYLAAKNKIFKKVQSECTKPEKITITIILSIFICISMGIGVDIPGITKTRFLQEILAGLISSFGSNLLHIILTILTGMKDTIEASNIRMRENRTAGIDKK
jgi:LytS/YehU family sensor histidine kinase